MYARIVLILFVCIITLSSSSCRRMKLGYMAQDDVYRSPGSHYKPGKVRPSEQLAGEHARQAKRNKKIFRRETKRAKREYNYEHSR